MSNTVGGGGIGDTQARPPTGSVQADPSASGLIDDGSVERSTAEESDHAPAARGDQEVDTLLQRAGLRRTDSGMVVSDAHATTTLDGSNASKEAYGAGANPLEPPSPPPITLTDQTRSAGKSFATNIDLVMDDFLLTTRSGGQLYTSDNGQKSPVNGDGGDRDFKSLAELSAEDLLAAFLKINIEDPNNNPETHNKLHELSTTLRQLAIENAKQEIRKAEEAKKEADRYAQHAEYISAVVTAVSVISFLVTLGTSAAASSALLAAKESVMAGLRQTIQTAVEQLTTQVRLAVEEAVKQLIKNGIDLSTKAGQEALQKAVEEATEQVVQEVVKNTVQQAVNQAMKESAKNGITKTAEKSIEKMVLKTVRDQLVEVSQEAATHALKNGVVQASMNGLTPAARQAVVSAAQKGAELGAQSGLETAVHAAVQEAARQVASVAPEGITGFMNSNYSTISSIGLGTTAGGQVLEAGSTYHAANLDANTAQLRNDARGTERISDRNQSKMEREAEVMKRIMEDKNNVVDAVMSMLEASFNSAQKLSAATQSRA